MQRLNKIVKLSITPRLNIKLGLIRSDIHMLKDTVQPLLQQQTLVEGDEDSYLLNW